MCGIIGVVRRRSTREPPELGALLVELDDALARIVGWSGDAKNLLLAAASVEEVDVALRGVAGVRALLADRVQTRAIEHRADELATLLADAERALDAGDVVVDAAHVEAVNAALLRAKDATWAVGKDRLRNARAVGELAGADASLAAIEAFTSVQVALSALDRLEVRGRDSAGLHLLVRGHVLDLAAPEVAAMLEPRRDDVLFGDGAVRTPDGMLSFVYKAAAEIGDLGDNTQHLRAAIGDDELLHLALESEVAEVVVLGHTLGERRHHLRRQRPPAQPRRDRAHRWSVRDGGAERRRRQLRRPRGVGGAGHAPRDHHRRQGDPCAHVAPARCRRGSDRGVPEHGRRARGIGRDRDECVRRTRSTLPRPAGSGQALYVGLAEDAFVVASEPYGLVEETASYVRLDGETPADPDRADATRGQIAVLVAAEAGTLDGIELLAYDGSPVALSDADVHHAEITTRDIDRGEFPHYLLKEISEAPDSFRKTLRGKIVESDSGRLSAALGPEALPEGIRHRLQDGKIERVVVIGQGTAAVAGQSLTAALAPLVAGRLVVDGVLHATELSGFELKDDMSDTLVIAISQSGTTTDTNRTVDLARARGAVVIAIVNRRNSDLVDKSDGVLFTSDGRDVEMSVASTKAFYAQIAAGRLLALAVAEAAGVLDAEVAHHQLVALRELPDAMRAVVATRDHIAAVAHRHVLTRRYWALVGNGVNAIAAGELRIKLSELCYKAIACDVTEDKKHIDLSSEPLIIVCASGLTGSTADDVGKEVAIYRAHRAAPIVIAAEDGRFPAALETIAVGSVHPQLDFVLATVAGHLFGYDAALAIDASALPLREGRAAVEAAAAGPPEALLERLAPLLEEPARRFHDGLRVGSYDGSLEASTGARLASILRYATGSLTLDSYELEHGKVGTPSTVVEDLTAALTKGIEELTRPVDAIKHQAKTVTVGISRSDETLLQAPIVRAVLAAGAPRDGLSYRALRTLVGLDPAVVEVTGFTRYRIEGDVDGDAATLHVVDRGGVATGIPSRTETDPHLRGTKHRVATQREVTAVRGRRDGRTLVLVPEVKHNETVGLTLLHVRFAEHLPSDAMRAVLQGYQGRYGALKDAVTETEPAFDETVLATVPVVDLLTEPVYVLAGALAHHCRALDAAVLVLVLVLVLVVVEG